MNSKWKIFWLITMPRSNISAKKLKIRPEENNLLWRKNRLLTQAVLINKNLY